ncbi:hypothetical protein BC827DRAFT_1268372 [Russula dissimulans]|nr:hypothetical protein BC827DRAFT_1268372 [Russula dissimulans]
MAVMKRYLAGGQPPFELTVVPVFSTQSVYKISNSGFSNGAGTFDTKLTFPATKRLVLVMSDATGFATGGVSPLLTGVVPAGSGIELNPTNGTSESVWTAANVPAGTSMLFYMTDAMNRKGGVSALMTSHASGDNSCINSMSPSTTAVIASSTHAPTTSPISGSKKLSAGAISGIAVGGAIGLAAFVAPALLFRFRKRKASTVRSDHHLIDIDENFHEHPELLSQVDPFPPPSAQSRDSDASPEEWTHFASPERHFIHSHPTETRTVAESSVAVAVTLQPPTSSSRARKGKTTSAGPGSPNVTRFIVHTDAGDVIHDDNEDEVVELPPRYNNSRQSLFPSAASNGTPNDSGLP